MRHSALFLVLALLTATACNRSGEELPPPAPEPAAAVAPEQVLPLPPATPGKAVPQEDKQSYSVCLKYCVMVMDQAGQVTDECPKECRANPGAYSKDDLHTDDQDNGLIAFPGCLKDCADTPGATIDATECEHSCCVESCVLRQEYKGSGSAAKARCPAMCREFLERTASD